LVAVVATLGLMSILVATAGPAAAASKTIEVETACQISGPVVEPECLQSVQAYFDQVNAAGGVKGYRLQVASCDTQTNPVTDANCTASAYANPKILAFVARGGAISPIPTDKIVDIGPVIDNPAMANAPNSFPVSVFSAAPAGDPGFQAEASYFLKRGGANKPGVIACNLAGCEADIQGAVAFYKTKGITAVTATAPLSQVDFTPQITLFQHDGVNAVDIIEGAAGDVGVLKASQSLSYSPKFLNTWGVDDAAALDQLPNVPDDYAATPLNPAPAANAPYIKLMNKYIGKGKWKLSGWGLNSYLAAMLFVDDVAKINGPITRSSILAGMKHITNFSSPLLGTSIDFAKPGPVAGDPTIRNWYYYLATIHNHQLVPLLKAALNAQP
jgi:branched-chain amino acid transport system substrate-binding protein